MALLYIERLLKQKSGAYHPAPKCWQLAAAAWASSSFQVRYAGLRLLDDLSSTATSHSQQFGVS